MQRKLTKSEPKKIPISNTIDELRYMVFISKIENPNNTNTSLNQTEETIENQELFNHLSSYFGGIKSIEEIKSSEKNDKNKSIGLLVSFENDIIAKRLTKKKEIKINEKKYSVSAIDHNGNLVSQYPFKDDDIFDLILQFFVLLIEWFIQFIHLLNDILKKCCHYSCYCCCRKDDFDD